MEHVKLIRAFGILNRTFMSYISASLSDIDLSYSDSIFLVNIGDRDGVTQEELADSLAIDKAAVARSVKSMETKGYLRTERSKADKRAKELYLSESGKELFEHMRHVNQQWVDHVFEDLDPSETSSFSQMIDRISSRAKSI